ncbi:porin [Breoghania sp.]|uniref:porin n=1 Tax=Breoghania sp. TaxID=2065378 RepID=UPI002AA71E84|nr:porin [Breoghania sp.]
MMRVLARKFTTLAALSATAALLPAVALAADLPVGQEPVDYVRVCYACSPGFFYIPGTETCLRVGGGMRVELRFRDFTDDGNTN